MMTLAPPRFARNPGVFWATSQAHNPLPHPPRRCEVTLRSISCAHPSWREARHGDTTARAKSFRVVVAMANRLHGSVGRVTQSEPLPRRAQLHMIYKFEGERFWHVPPCPMPLNTSASGRRASKRQHYRRRLRPGRVPDHVTTEACDTIMPDSSLQSTAPLPSSSAMAKSARRSASGSPRDPHARERVAESLEVHPPVVGRESRSHVDEVPPHLQGDAGRVRLQ